MTRIAASVFGLILGGVSWLPVLLAAEIVIYGFEGTPEGWTIPDWARTSEDYVGRDLSTSTDFVEEGNAALRLQAVFPGDRWTGAYVEREVEVTDCVVSLRWPIVREAVEKMHPALQYVFLRP